MPAYKFWGEMFRRQNRSPLYLRQNGTDERAKQRVMVDLRLCNVGMSCEEYSTIYMAGISDKKIPPAVRERMNKHYDACAYHRSSRWIQSALDTPVTEELEKEALAIIAKYSQRTRRRKK